MRRANFHFDGAAVLVTGGTSGIGRAIAEGFAEAGADVAVTGRTEEEVAAFSTNHDDVRRLALDVTDAEAVAAVVGTFERLDVLVNCAGTIARNLGEHEPEPFAHVVDVNLLGTMRTAYACRSLLAASRGCVLNTASMLTFFGSGTVPAYAASKGGVGQLAKSLAIAWAEDGIRVNAIAPGWIATAFTQPLMDDPHRSRSILERTPLRRWGATDDVVGAALFLCSDAAAFVTGAVLPVDGGYSVA